MKKTLLILLSLGIINFSSFSQIIKKPRLEGIIDLSYVPYRIDDILRNNEMKAGITIEGILPMKKSEFFIRGNSDAYGGIKNPYYGFKPHKLCSNIYVGYRRNNIEIYGRHSSNHPIDDVSVSVYNKGNYYWINEYDAITEVGVKIKIGLRNEK